MLGFLSERRWSGRLGVMVVGLLGCGSQQRQAPSHTASVSVPGTPSPIVRVEDHPIHPIDYHRVDSGWLVIGDIGEVMPLAKLEGGALQAASEDECDRLRGRSVTRASPGYTELRLPETVEAPFLGRSCILVLPESAGEMDPWVGAIGLPLAHDRSAVSLNDDEEERIKAHTRSVFRQTQPSYSATDLQFRMWAVGIGSEKRVVVSVVSEADYGPSVLVVVDVEGVELTTRTVWAPRLLEGCEGACWLSHHWVGFVHLEGRDPLLTLVHHYVDHRFFSIWSLAAQGVRLVARGATNNAI